ncbi:hypothetical protein AAC387_Pa09g0148 [Persea americana]
MDARLHKAAIRGDVTSLRDLLQRDEHILDGVGVGVGVGVMVMHDPIPNKNPLHVAAQFGHVDFAQEILNRKPEYAHKLNSQGQSPLHLASGAGHVEVVKLLVEKDAGVCFICDKRGGTPLHVAARKGRLEVLKELVLAEPTAAWVLTEQGEPILHLCASNGQFEALKMLIELIPDDDFVKMKDDDDNSILHLLAPEMQTEVIKSLLGNRGPEVNSLNVNNCFLASASIILLLISGFNLKREELMWALMFAMWISVGSMLFSYGVSSRFLIKNYFGHDSEKVKNLDLVLNAISVFAAFALIGPLVTAHLVRLAVPLCKKFKKRILNFKRRDSMEMARIFR